MSRARTRKRLVTTDELAVMLQVSRSTVYRLARNKEVPHFRVGRGGYRFDPEQVVAALRVEVGAE